MTTLEWFLLGVVSAMLVAFAIQIVTRVRMHRTIMQYERSLHQMIEYMEYESIIEQHMLERMANKDERS